MDGERWAVAAAVENATICVESALGHANEVLVVVLQDDMAENEGEDAHNRRAFLCAI